MKFNDFYNLCHGLLKGLVKSGFKINHSISIGEGQTIEKELATVNGSIFIGSGCEIKGNCYSVNGNIEIGSHSRAKGIITANGGIRIEKSVIVQDTIYIANGSLRCDEGVEVGQDVNIGNGVINLTRTTIYHDMNISNSNIFLLNKSILRGSIIVEKSRGSFFYDRVKIEIAGNSVVQGDIVVRSKELKVKVILKEGGCVKGKIINAEVIQK